MECKKEENKKSCACTYGCPKSGLCCECVKYHRERRQIPACFFSPAAEITFDRAFAHFANLVKNGEI